MRWISFIVIVLLLSGCINPFKHPFNEKQDVKKLIYLTEQQIKDEHWKDAVKLQDEMQKGWEQIRTRVSLNASSDDLRDLETSIALLKTYVVQEDKTESLAELNKLKQLWVGIANL